MLLIFNKVLFSWDMPSADLEKQALTVKKYTLVEMNRNKILYFLIVLSILPKTFSCIEIEMCQLN